MRRSRRSISAPAHPRLRAPLTFLAPTALPRGRGIDLSALRAGGAGGTGPQRIAAVFPRQVETVWTEIAGVQFAIVANRADHVLGRRLAETEAGLPVGAFQAEQPVGLDISGRHGGRHGGGGHIIGFGIDEHTHDGLHDVEPQPVAMRHDGAERFFGDGLGKHDVRRGVRERADEAG